MAPQRSPARVQQGFTLFEMLVAMVVAAILAAIALPAYQDHVRRGRRADAMAALTAVQQAQERYRANVAGYTTDLSDLQGVSANSPDGHYTIAISAAAAAGYTITATAKGSSPQYSDTACRVLTLRMAGGNIAYQSSDASGQVDSANANRCWTR